MWNQRVIISNAVPLFLEKGGCLEYRPVAVEKGWHWELWGIYPDRDEQPILSVKTGQQRIFKSADALLAYHVRLFEEETGLYISTSEPIRTRSLQPKD
ncbi:hypothetical protein SAMN04488118_11751 [Epibacterium ulvae]|uniref:Uncharacterized protein n=1 Tax=Epibacterium ulvae TaxID=1156985 RepID=A0A1G5RJJ4_9RHOB|nr:hypothetical protein SAMN04488118_11751 [Epibacterium ulvae]